MDPVFITGGTGYVGRPLIEALLDRGRKVFALVRPGSVHAYIAVRREGERLVTASGIPATILRPWYVLGPGHWWPYLLVPVYAALRCVPGLRDGAERLGLVTRRSMVAALVRAVDVPPAGAVRIVEVPQIRVGPRS